MATRSMTEPASASADRPGRPRPAPVGRRPGRYSRVPRRAVALRPRSWSLALAVAAHQTDLSATKMAVSDKFLPPAFLAGGRWDHLLGTDQLGRDLFVRSLIGLQNALLIGVVTVV